MKCSCRMQRMNGWRRKCGMEEEEKIKPAFVWTELHKLAGELCCGVNKANKRSRRETATMIHHHLKRSGHHHLQLSYAPIRDTNNCLQHRFIF